MHKYGFHVNRTGDDVFDAIRRIRPGVIKTVEHDVGFWRRVREIHPQVFLIGRLVVEQHEQEKFPQDPAGAGQRFAQRVLQLEACSAHIQGRQLFDAWESYNEVLPGSASAQQKRAYDEFQVAFAEPIKAAGFEPVAMNFGTGNMLGEDFLECFPGTLESYTYLGFHEYDWPDMWRLHEQNILEKNEGGMWLALRYRRIMNEVRAVHGDRHIAVVTECGMTQGVQGRSDVGPWHESHPVSEQRYWDSLMWYSGELMQDDYLLAACLFVVGAIPPWHSFEHLGAVVDRLERLQTGSPPSVASRPSLPAPPSAQEAQSSPSPAAPAFAEELQRALMAEGARQPQIELNPQAALLQRLIGDGFVPTSNQFNVSLGGSTYMAQQAQNLTSGERRLYYGREGDWDHLPFAPVTREAGMA